MPTIISAPHCVQCQEEMEYGITFFADNINHEEEMIRLQICHNPKCPNYGLMQLGIEGMK